MSTPRPTECTCTYEQEEQFCDLHDPDFLPAPESRAEEKVAERLKARGPLKSRKSLVFDVLLPPRALSPNRKGSHWTQRLRPTRVYRGDVGMLALSAMREQNWVPSEYFGATVSLDFNVVKIPRGLSDGLYRPRDVDNAIAAFKAGLDGMTDAGCWSDDSVVQVVSATISHDSKKLPGVTVRVYYGREA